MTLFKEYLLVGGLPAVVASWSAERSLSKINQIHNDLLATYRDDFAKYRGRIATARLDETINAIPKMLGQKFVFSRVNSSVQAPTMKQVLTLLSRARICHYVWSCSANGVPLAAEIKEKYFKEIFLDTGLCCASLGLNLNQMIAVDEIIMINSGGIAEQIVGQMLRTVHPFYIEPALYYWHREERGSNAEIDYVIQHNGQVIPVEVKAGGTGGLKSLHSFMGLKKNSVAVRINSELPSKTNVHVKGHTGNSIEYLLISIPFYLVGEIHRLLDVVTKI
jgi:predicted AAA+ superfamily ATPase